MHIIQYLFPVALFVFGLCWYLHVVQIAIEKKNATNPLLGLLLFYVPLLAII